MDTFVDLSTFFTPAGFVILIALLASDLRKTPPKAPAEPRLVPKGIRPIPTASPGTPAAVKETKAILQELLAIIADGNDDPRIAALAPRIDGLGHSTVAPEPTVPEPESPEHQSPPIDAGRLTGAQIFGT